MTRASLPLCICVLPLWHQRCAVTCACCITLQAFSQLGGLQLDRDIRSLVAAAGELTSKPVRDKFARLTQVRMVVVLCGLHCVCVEARAEGCHCCCCPRLHAPQSHPRALL